MLTYKTYCPCFPGFYNSFLFSDIDDMEACDECISIFGNRHELQPGLIEEILKTSNLEIQCDFDNYQHEAAKRFCNAVAERLCELFGENQCFVWFNEIISPREYNFRTDEVRCEIAFSPYKAIKYCTDHLEAFEKYLIENYKSRSGFISFIDYHPESWLNSDNWTDRHPEGILRFILQNEDKDVEYNLSEKVFEYISLAEFYSMPDELETLFELDEVKAIAEKFNNGELDKKTAAAQILSYRNKINGKQQEGA